MGTDPSPNRRRLSAAGRARRRSGRCPDGTSGRRRNWAERAALFLQFHHSDAAASLVVRRGTEIRDERMRAQKLRDRPTKRTRAVSVNDAQALQIVDRRLVEEPLDAADR